MPPIRARTATGAEFSFPTRDDFRRAVSVGRITPDWEVFHSRARRWLPVTVHPAFSAEPEPATPAPAQRARTSDLVLIYPDFVPSADTVEAHEPASDPFEGGPILAPEEIQRVLHAPRQGEPRAATAMGATGAGSSSAPRPSGPVPVHPLIEKALPTFSRALNVAAELVHTRIS
jgi:hypothetical protein